MKKRISYTDGFKTLIVELVILVQAPKNVASEYSLSKTAVTNLFKRKAPIVVGEGDPPNLEQNQL